MAVIPSDQKIAIPGGEALFHGMPGRLKVLYIAAPSRTGAWLAEAFAADSAAEILLEEAAGQAAGMERLRDEVFDAILVSHEPGELDALDLIEGYRTGGAEEPIVVLGAPVVNETGSFTCVDKVACWVTTGSPGAGGENPRRSDGRAYDARYRMATGASERNAVTKAGSSTRDGSITHSVVSGWVRRAVPVGGGRSIGPIPVVT